MNIQVLQCSEINNYIINDNTIPEHQLNCCQEAYRLQADIVMTLNDIFTYIFPETGRNLAKGWQWEKG